MFDKIITYSVRNKFVIGMLVLALIGWGSYSLTQLPIDAIPDVTDNQVQVITNSPNLTAQEIEKFITSPVELALQNLPNVVQLRSISRFGFSMVTVVFEDDMGTYLPRELVAQQLKKAETEIPNGLGTPEMTPISSGLGEIYQYTLSVKKGFEDKYDAMKLREIQDWIVKRQLSGIKGVVEVNSFGGKLKQYEVTINPSQLKRMGVTITEVFEALENSNENTGGAYIEKDPNAYFIRSEGLAETPEDIEKIVVKNQGGTPILIRDVATVKLGFAPRFGALTRNGANTHHLETSVGAAFLYNKTDYENSIGYAAANGAPGLHPAFFLKLYPAGTFGYRYHKPDGILMFRTGVGFPEIAYLGIGLAF